MPSTTLQLSGLPECMHVDSCDALWELAICILKHCHEFVQKMHHKGACQEVNTAQG